MFTEGFDPLPGERVLWSGAPKRFPIFVPTDWVAVPAGLAFTGMAVFWTFQDGGISASNTIFHPGYALIAIALYLLVGRLVVRTVGLRRTRYLVTNKRVVIIRDRWRRVRSMYLSDLGPPSMTVASDGTGSIEFSDPTTGDPVVTPGRFGGARLPDSFILHGVEGPRQVRDLIASARAER